MTTALALGWAAVVIRSARGDGAAWLDRLRDAIRHPPQIPALSGLAVACGRHSVTVLVLASLAALAWLAGRRVAALVRAPRVPPAAGFGFAVASGWGLLGFLLLGLALTGLFQPAVVLSAIAVAGAAGIGAPGRLPVLPRLDRGTAAILAVVGLPGVVLGVAALLPDVFYDTYANHLAAPAHVLGLHRLVTAGQHYTINYQLASELLNALAIVFRRDEIAHGVSLIPFLAGLGVAAAWTARVAGPRAAALGAALALDLGGFWWVVLRGKNDPAAAGFILLAVVFSVDRRWILSSLCWGFALAAKLNAYMLAMPAAALAAFVILRAPAGRRGRTLAWSAGLAAIPALPWMVRSWLDRGTPWWPLLSARFHGVPWEPDTVVALAQYHTGPSFVTESLSSFVPTWLADNPILLWALPVAAWQLRRAPAALRRMGGWAAMLFLFLFGVIHMEYGRYSLPILVLLGFACAPAILSMIPSGRGRWIGWAAVVALAWAPAAGALREMGLGAREIAGYASGAITNGEWMDRVLTTRRAAQQAVAAMPGVRGVVLVDEVYAYGWPGRVRTDEIPGRAIPWVLTHEASTPARVRVGLRQLRASHLVLNYVSEGHPYNASIYEWSDRQLELWRAFLKRHAERVAIDLPCDVPNGGFCLWRLVASAPPEPLFYLLGIKPLRVWIRKPYLDAGDAPASAARALAVSARFPDVLVFKADAGLFLAGSGEWARGYPLLRECAAAGMVGEALHTYLGSAAMHLNRYDEALRHLATAGRLYPGARADIEARTGEVLARKARAELRAGLYGRALDLAIEAVRLAPASSFSLVTLADVRMVRGETAEALAGYLRLASLAGVPDGIRRHADEMIARCRATPSGSPGTSPR
ncbi:MAG: hypothetical protein AAB152_04830 [Candidatus Coatesbacteria bacterium]